MDGKPEGRLSSFLRGELNMSTGLMNKLKWGDALRVNGAAQRTNYPVSPGDVITVAFPEETPEYPAEDGELSILYEDEAILAVDKPAGMLIHPSRAKNTGTLANLVAGYYQKTGQHLAFPPHDPAGSGHLRHCAAGEERLCPHPFRKTGEKNLSCPVYGRPEGDSGTIDAPIARRELPSLLRYVNQEGKPSLTRWRLLEEGDGWSKLALQPVTGRTHQLRVHCAYMGFPILGDPQYGSEESQTFSARLGLSHQMLCAKMLEFSHPITGKPMVLRSDMDVSLGSI